MKYTICASHALLIVVVYGTDGQMRGLTNLSRDGWMEQATRRRIQISTLPADLAVSVSEH